MADDLQYDVGVRLHAKGPINGQLARAGKNARSVGNIFTRTGSRLDSMGSSIMGSGHRAAAQWGKMAAITTALAGAGGLAKVARSGWELNNTLENANLTAATTFSLFKFGAKDARVLNGEMTAFQRNLSEAEAMQARLFETAKKSPATFGQVSQAYQAASAGLATQTEELGRHHKLMEKISLLGGITGGDYGVLGAQTGRMLAGSAGAELDVWKVLQVPIRTAMEEMGGDVAKKAKKADAEGLTRLFNTLEGDGRLRVMQQAMEGVSQEIADAWGNSLAGLTSTTQSAIQVLGSKMTKPLRNTWKGFLKRINAEGGVLGDKNLHKWEALSNHMGAKLDDAAYDVLRRVEHAATHIRDNWEGIIDSTYKAAQVAGIVIQGAFAMGLTRLMGGAAMRAAGGAMTGMGAIGSGYKALEGKLGKGLNKSLAHRNKKGEKGDRVARGIGRMMGLNRKRRDSKGKFMADSKPLMAIGRFLTLLVSAGPLLLGAGLAIGAIGVGIAGVAAYFVSAWDEISSALVNGLRDGSISLVPLLTAAYGLWGRLKLLGEVILGGSTHTDKMNGMLSIFTSMIEFASSGLSMFIQVMAIGVGIWGALKLAFQGVMWTVLKLIELLGEAQIVSVGTVAKAQANYASYKNSVMDTFTTADKLAQTADKLDNFKLKDADIVRIQEEAAAASKSLAESLENGFGGDDKLKAGGTNVNIGTMYTNLNVRDNDPTRMFAQWSDVVAKVADRPRQSSYLPQGL